MIWPPYECPTTTVGPSWKSSTWRSRATSSASDVSGNWGAVTRKPPAWRRSMTPLQHDPSARAPWTSTMSGRPFVSMPPFQAPPRRRCPPSDPDPILGARAPVHITRICDSKALGNELGMLAEAMMSPARGGDLHGREAELALIQRELARVAEGTGAVVLLEGGAGMGKSRLLAEVAGIARSLGFRVGTAAAE